MDAAVVDEILRLATRSPSAFNLQPWRFVVVQSAKNRDRLRGLTFAGQSLMDAPVVVIVLAFLHPHRTDLDAILDDEVAHGGLTQDEARGRKIVAHRTLENLANREVWAARTASMAASRLMTAAEGLGVASEVAEVHDVEKLREAFGIPDDHVVCNLIALGCSRQEPSFAGRLPLDAVVFEEHFGQPWFFAGETSVD